MEEKRDLNAAVSAVGVDLNAIKQRWDNFSRPVKISLVVVAAATLLVVGVLVVSSVSSPPMEVLFSDSIYNSLGRLLPSWKNIT